MSRRLASIAAALIAAALALAGCGRATGKAEDGPSPATTARVELAEGGPKLPVDAATAAATLPADFPKAIPIHPGAKVLVATTSVTLGKPAWAATLETGDGREQVSAFYKAGLGAFKRDSGMRMADTDMSVWVGPDYDLTLLLTTSAERTTVINLSVAKK